MWESENQDESPLMTTDNFHGIDRLVSLLRKRSMVLEGRQADTSARQLSLKPLSRKISVYWLSLKGLGLTLEDLHVS